MGWSHTIIAGMPNASATSYASVKRTAALSMRSGLNASMSSTTGSKRKS